MTIEEIIDQLKRLVSSGQAPAEAPVLVRNAAVTDEMVSAGSNPYVEVTDIVVDEHGVEMVVDA